MKDFLKTKSMVERWNILATCLLDPNASDEERQGTTDEMFHLSAQIPFVAQREFIDVADIADLQWWFDLWARIICKLEKLPKMADHATKTYELSLFGEMGETIRETARIYNLVTPQLPEHFNSTWDAIEAAQSTITDRMGQHPIHDEERRFRAKYECIIKDMDSFLKEVHLMENSELKRFHERNFSRSSITLKEFVNDVISITPERERERGWNYQAIKKH